MLRRQTRESSLAGRTGPSGGRVSLRTLFGAGPGLRSQDSAPPGVPFRFAFSFHTHGPDGASRPVSCGRGHGAPGPSRTLGADVPPPQPAPQGAHCGPGARPPAPPWPPAPRPRRRPAASGGAPAARGLTRSLPLHRPCCTQMSAASGKPVGQPASTRLSTSLPYPGGGLWAGTLTPPFPQVPLGGSKKTPGTIMPSSPGPPRRPSSDPSATLGDAEAARQRFRGFCYQDVAGPQEALTRLQELCRRWLRPEVRSKEQMLELLVLEQFLGALPPEIQAWVRDQRPGSPEEAAALVEGLQHNPGQLLGWITAHVLKQAVLPAPQKAEDSLGSLHPPGIVEPLRAAAGEGPKDAQMEGSAQLSCSVKKEPDADGQEMAPASPPNPAQSQEGPVGPGGPDSASFHPPRIQEDWGLLNPSQKELYWDAMLEKYGTVVSLGLPSPQPEARAESEPGAPNSAGPEGPGSLRPGGESANRREGPPWEGPSGSAAPGAVRSKPYTCEQCGSGFDWKSVFVIHHRTHAGGQGARAPALAGGGAEKPLQGPREPGAPRHPRHAPPAARKNYACEECGRSFSWKSQLVIHRKSHAGQRHFCSDCGRGFDWKSQLVIHRKSHRPEDP